MRILRKALCTSTSRCTLPETDRCDCLPRESRNSRLSFSSGYPPYQPLHSAHHHLPPTLPARSRSRNALHRTLQHQASMGRHGDDSVSRRLGWWRQKEARCDGAQVCSQGQGGGWADDLDTEELVVARVSNQLSNRCYPALYSSLSRLVVRRRGSRSSHLRSCGRHMPHTQLIHIITTPRATLISLVFSPTLLVTLFVASAAPLPSQGCVPCPQCCRISSHSASSISLSVEEHHRQYVVASEQQTMPYLEPSPLPAEALSPAPPPSAASWSVEPRSSTHSA